MGYSDLRLELIRKKSLENEIFEVQYQIKRVEEKIDELTEIVLSLKKLNLR